MRKRMMMGICIILFSIAVFCPLYAGAATPLDPTEEASLTLHYQKEGQVFPELPISIYRVAEAFPDGTFELIEPFASYPVSIYDITMQEQWKHTAATLSAYILADQLAPCREEQTDADGTATFTQLETGLYLVCEEIAENESGTCVFAPFMVYLPTPQPDGTFDYHVEATPKCVNYVPKTEYRVTKLWQDAGHQNDRPEEIQVEIYRDGELQERQTLSASNNWSYRWYVSADDQGVWTVVERSVSDGYTVTVQHNGGCFTIVNTHKSNEEIPDSPKTGDTANLFPWIVAACFSGLMLMIMSAYGRRRRKV